VSLEHSPARAKKDALTFADPSYTVDEFCRVERMSRSASRPQISDADARSGGGHFRRVVLLAHFPTLSLLRRSFLPAEDSALRR
jgi:hypothetical protein